MTLPTDFALELLGGRITSGGHPVLIVDLGPVCPDCLWAVGFVRSPGQHAKDDLTPGRNHSLACLGYWVSALPTGAYNFLIEPSASTPRAESCPCCRAQVPVYQRLAALVLPEDR